MSDNNQGSPGDDESVNTVAGLVNSFIVCYSTKISNKIGIWQGENPLKVSLPLFLMQLTCVIGITCLLLLLLKPLRQPRFVAELLAGILMSPSVLGKIPLYTKWLLPFRSLKSLETIANLGLLYFLFLLGLEMDITTISRTGKKALNIALSGVFLPLGFGAGLIYYLQRNTPGFHMLSLLFWGVTLTVTSFPVLTLILADLKLLHTEIGKAALSSAIVGNVFLWFLLVVTLGISNNGKKTHVALLLTTAFALFCIYAVRPAIKWMIRRIPEGETVSDLLVCFVLVGVVLCGLVTDVFGMHSFTGAFVFGLIIPNADIRAAVAERFEDAVSGLLLPLFFLITGLRANFDSLMVQTWKVVIVIVEACVAKIISTFLVTFSYDMGVREGMALGVLMNTKDLLALVILRLGRDLLILDDESYATLLLAILFMTTLVTPLMHAIYRPSKRYMQHKIRTIQRAKPDTELRILTCIHDSRSVHGVINLLEASHATRQSPISVFVLHLIELTGRASAMLIVHSARKSGVQKPSRQQAEADNIINAVESYEQEFNDVSVQPLTVLSPYATMDEDICSLAEDKRAAMIIIPFHKQLTIDGKMKDTHPAFRGINQNVLAKAPCSVGIFVNRGLNSSPSIESLCRIAMFYVVGRDDREALSYAWRMAGRVSVSLDVIRFLPGEDAMDLEPMDLPGDSEGILSVITDYEREKQRDDTFINEFRLRTASNNSITYSERVLNSGEETVTTIRAMDHDYDLYIVGRGQGVISPLTAGLADWTDDPELGAIGDILVSSEFANSASVLVVQQYAGAGHAENELGMLRHREQLNNFAQTKWPPAGNDGLESFVHHRGCDNHRMGSNAQGSN